MSSEKQLKSPAIWFAAFAGMMVCSAFGSFSAFNWHGTTEGLRLSECYLASLPGLVPGAIAFAVTKQFCPRVTIVTVVASTVAFGTSFTVVMLLRAAADA